MFDHSLESSPRDNSNKGSNIGFGAEITQVQLIEVNFNTLSGALYMYYFQSNRVHTETTVDSRYVDFVGNEIKSRDNESST